ncbi:MAG: cell division cycle 123 family protein [Candidatus Cloacimonetes bacterium]|jgi:hypothetical protein|nr:cell division cycle 123 family protein [Candidatus Cloacimonadota bacterium]
MNYWEIVKPIYIENWEPALHSLSIASIDIPLTVDDAKRLGSNIIEFGEAFGCMADISDISSKVSSAVEKMPSGAFVRLGSRSPKDSWMMQEEGGKVLPGEDPLRFMLDCSERIYEDLMLSIQQSYNPHIWVRQWTDIPKWSEFRCFMQNRKLVGISQYYYDEEFPEIDADMFEWAIQEFFGLFLKATKMESVVFDVYIKLRKVRPNIRDIEVKLLEINPFFELTDPCLFSWHGTKPFDGSFKYIKANAPNLDMGTQMI